MTKFFDTRARLEQEMTEKQMHQGTLLCLNNDSRLKIGTLCPLNLLFDFRESHTIDSRSEHLRNELLTFNFFETLKSLDLQALKLRVL